MEKTWRDIVKENKEYASNDLAGFSFSFIEKVIKKNGLKYVIDLLFPEAVDKGKYYVMPCTKCHSKHMTMHKESVIHSFHCEDKTSCRYHGDLATTYALKYKFKKGEAIKEILYVLRTGVGREDIMEHAQLELQIMSVKGGDHVTEEEITGIIPRENMDNAGNE